MTTDIASIRNDIPAPPPRREKRYGFRQMAVGESFAEELPAEPDKRKVRAHMIRTYASRAGRKLGYSFSCSVRTEDGTSVIRVWRVA